MNAKNKFTQEKIGGFWPLFFLFIVISIHFYFFNWSYLPISEGWFNTYSQYVLNGKIVYKDFNFYLTPLYLHLFALFSYFFGDDIYTLRTIGFFINFGICIFIYLNFKNYFDTEKSLLATLCSFFYYQSGVAFISYDFTQVFTLFALITFYCCNKTFHSNNINNSV